MKKERLFYLDFIRAVAAIIVVIYHFNCRFEYYGINGFNDIFLEHANGNWGYIGVTLFFLISGVALMYNYSNNIDYKSYAIKRFKSIYPMFWIAYIVAFFSECLINKEIVSIFDVKFLLSIVGMDGYFLYLAPNFYKVGEWFLGAIIFIYIAFPFCRYLIKKNKKVATMSILLLGMVKYILLLNYPFNMSPTRNIVVCIFSFMLGMYIIEYIKRIKGCQALTALVIFIIMITIKFPITNAIIASVPGTLLFFVLVYISKYINNERTKTMFETISKYSYAIFLVHHIIILQIEKRVAGMTLGLIEVLAMFVITMLVILISTKVLYMVTDYIMRKIDKAK